MWKTVVKRKQIKGLFIKRSFFDWIKNLQSGVSFFRKGLLDLGTVVSLWKCVCMCVFISVCARVCVSFPPV